jgi:hypothetical protein
MMNISEKLDRLAHGGELLESIEVAIERRLRGGTGKVETRRELGLPDFRTIDAIDHMIHAPDDAE